MTKNTFLSGMCVALLNGNTDKDWVSSLNFLGDAEYRKKKQANSGSFVLNHQK